MSGSNANGASSAKMFFTDNWHDAAIHHRMYAQAQASIAICEIYGMTKDDKFKKPAQLALDFAEIAAQRVELQLIGGFVD